MVFVDFGGGGDCAAICSNGEGIPTLGRARMGSLIRCRVSSVMYSRGGVSMYVCMELIL